MLRRLRYNGSCWVAQDDEVEEELRQRGVDAVDMDPREVLLDDMVGDAARDVERDAADFVDKVGDPCSFALSSVLAACRGFCAALSTENALQKIRATIRDSNRGVS